MKKWLIPFVVFLLLFGSVRLYYNLTDDFRLSNITHPLPPRTAWDFPQNSEDLASIFDQPFTYLGKGAQVYAFGSSDGRYVVKFFKFKHLKPSFFISTLPPLGPLKTIKEQNEKRKLRKLEGVFEGHRIAYQNDQANSGLLYLHFNPTQHLHIKARLIDKIGMEHQFDLDPLVFVVQRKGETLRTTLARLFEEGNEPLALKRAQAILDMYSDEYQHGVYDRDHGISHNTGFIQDHPFHLDVGKFSYLPEQDRSLFCQNDLKHVATKIKAWVQENYPEAYPAFSAGLDQHLQYLLALL